ncbi:hypothetical protein [Gottfriedia solisilvae]|uniref:hypothetical protein n=1 Tax=Gottfriedia solisilvae TaxID=1516104 RepID=UPI003D2F0CCE
MKNVLIKSMKDQQETIKKILEQEWKDHPFLNLQEPLVFHTYTNGFLIYASRTEDQLIVLVKVNVYNFEILAEYQDSKGDPYVIGTL